MRPDTFPHGYRYGRTGGAAPGMAPHRIAALALQLVHLAWFASLLGAGFDGRTLAISGGVSMLLHGGFLVAEYHWNGFRATPILFYVTAGVFRLGVGALYVSTAAAAGQWRLLTVGAYDVSAFLMHGHWLALLGDWCFLAGYVAVTSVRDRGAEPRVAFAPVLWGRVWGVGLTTAAVTLLLRLATAGVDSGGFDSLLRYVQDYGGAAGVCLMLLAARRGPSRSRALRTGVAYLLLGLDLVEALFSYMKAPLLVAVLPVVLIFFDDAPRVRGRAAPRLAWPLTAACLLVYVFLFVVSAYSNERRANWTSPDRVERADRYAVPVVPHLATALLAAVPGTTRFEEAHEFPNGAWVLIRRMSVAPLPAWAYMRVESVGVNPRSFFEDLLASVTPRILWPDKPQLSWGRNFAVITGQFRSFDVAGSATALTMQGAYYWWGGSVWLILGSAASGAAFAALWLLFRNERLLNPASAMVWLLLCHEGVRWMESAFLGGFDTFLYCFIVLAPLQLVMRRVIGYRAERAGRTA